MNFRLRSPIPSGFFLWPHEETIHMQCPWESYPLGTMSIPELIWKNLWVMRELKASSVRWVLIPKNRCWLQAVCSFSHLSWAEWIVARWKVSGLQFEQTGFEKQADVWILEAIEPIWNCGPWKYFLWPRSNNISTLLKVWPGCNFPKSKFLCELPCLVHSFRGKLMKQRMRVWSYQPYILNRP